MSLFERACPHSQLCADCAEWEQLTGEELDARQAVIAASRADADGLREAVREFLDHHDAGQPGGSVYPMTNREEEFWQHMWDRNLNAVRAALAQARAAQQPAGGESER